MTDHGRQLIVPVFEKTVGLLQVSNDRPAAFGSGILEFRHDLLTALPHLVAACFATGCGTGARIFFDAGQVLPTGANPEKILLLIRSTVW